MWEETWRRLSKRADLWMKSADVFLRHFERVGALDEQANKALGVEGGRILDAIDAMELPPAVRKELDSVRTPLETMRNVSTGKYLVANRLVVLMALRAPLDEFLRETEEPRRRLVDLAFLHLNRTLVVDGDVRKRWQAALDQETRCEQLGALHLLSHRIFAFKADAGSGRTDLILGEPVEITDAVTSAAAMVLTEWKVVRDGDAVAKAHEGKVQAQRYASVELVGFELRKHRYVVLVSAEQLPMPESETIGDATYHYINVVVERARPSVESRRPTRKRL
jgi:hypothetical protein